MRDIQWGSDGRSKLPFYPPVSKMSREVANLNERKYLHTPMLASKNGEVDLIRQSF